MKVVEYDRDLIRQCVQGKRSAQYSLYNQYAKGMYNVSVRLVGDGMLAEDILQEAFVEVFKNIGKFKGESTPGAWIKRIVVNKCITHLRKRKIHLTELEEVTHITDVASEEIEPTYEVQQIKMAMDQLPHGYKVVFSLYAMEGYDHEEISEILDISVSTSKSQYHRAKKKIKELIRQEL